MPCAGGEGDESAGEGEVGVGEVNGGGEVFWGGWMLEGWREGGGRGEGTDRGHSRFGGGWSWWVEWRDGREEGRWWEGGWKHGEVLVVRRSREC